MLLTVRKLRLENGLSLAEAAQRVGIAPAVLSRVETGQQVAWPGLRLRLSGLYGVSDSVLFREIDEAQNYLRELGGEARIETSTTT